MYEYSAHGKVLLLGGYSVLEMGNIGLVLATDAASHARITKREDNRVIINARGFGSIEGSVNSIDASNSKLAVAKAAVQTSLKYLDGIGCRLHGFELESWNDRQFSYNGFKSGLGSSAAATVAIVGATLGEFGITSKEIVHKLAQIAHSMANEKIGSGFDIASAVYGTIEYKRYSPSIIAKLGDSFNGIDIERVVSMQWDYSIRKVSIDKGLLFSMAKLSGGETGTVNMVKKVMEFKDASKDEYYELIRKINESNVNAISAMEKNDINGFADAFEEGRQLTKELGIKSNADIEPDYCSSIIEESKKNGALVAKLPGAGGMDSIIAVCTGIDKKNSLESFWNSLESLHLMDVDILH